MGLDSNVRRYSNLGGRRGKPNQNAYIESFNGRFRDECLNEHWFTSMAHARVIVEAWRREYNEERYCKVVPLPTVQS